KWQSPHSHDAWPGSADAYPLHGRDSLQRTRWLDAAGDSQYAKRFCNANRWHGTRAPPQPDRVLRAHAHQKHLQSVFGPPANGASGVGEVRQRRIRPDADKMPLLRFSRDVRVIWFTMPAGADAAE